MSGVSWRKGFVVVVLGLTMAGCASSNDSNPGTVSAYSAADAQLRDAAWANDVPRATGLVRRGADVNAKDGTEQSAYLIATSEGYLELLRLTLDNGADVNDKDSWNGTGLIRAAERGHADVVGRLIQAGIDRDHVNRIGYQAVHEAVWFGEDVPDYVDTLRVLVAGGVELDRPSDREGLSPLEMARERNFHELESLLTMAVSAPTVVAPDVELFDAAASGDADRVALALRAGAAIDAPDDRGRTAWEVAATADHGDTVRLLVAMGASTADS